MKVTFFEWLYKVCIVQTVCVVIILVSVLVIKYFFKDTFSQIQKFYNTHILSETKISEVLSDEI